MDCLEPSRAVILKARKEEGKNAAGTSYGAGRAGRSLRSLSPPEGGRDLCGALSNDAPSPAHPAAA